MRCLSFVLSSAAVAVLLVLCLLLGTDASRHRAGSSKADSSSLASSLSSSSSASSSSFERGANAGCASQEPDFATIEHIYKKGQLRSAAVRKHMNVGALPPASSNLGDLRLIWDLFYPDYNCPYGKSRHGRVGDGGKWVCGARKFLSKPGCVIYSLGSNAETSFETDVALETECEIHVFDPTQSSVPMPSTHRSGHENFHTYAIGDPAQNSTWQTKSLESVMNGLGHAWIDVLKMDIEGGEWDFLEYLFKEAKSIPVGQVRFFFKRRKKGSFFLSFQDVNKRAKEGKVCLFAVHVVLCFSFFFFLTAKKKMTNDTHIDTQEKH